MINCALVSFELDISQVTLALFEFSALYCQKKKIIYIRQDVTESQAITFFFAKKCHVFRPHGSCHCQLHQRPSKIFLSSWASNHVCIYVLEISIFFTKSCHCQTYQNYEQPPQSLKNLCFQRNLLATRIIQIFLIFFCEEYLTR